MEEMYKKCDLCNSNGWTAEHNLRCVPSGECINCPVQEPCQKCNATGYVPFPPHLREVTDQEIDTKAEQYASRENSERYQFVDGVFYEGFVDGARWMREQMKE